MPLWVLPVVVQVLDRCVLRDPVGLNLYVLQSLAPAQVSISDAIIGCLPFIGALCLLIVLLLLFPQLALWLPSLMR
jgi:TRAP-type mannitol/chloroaromatic compound transport system permease large subunit